MHDIQTTVMSVEPLTSRDGSSVRFAVALTGGVAPDGTQYPPEKYVTFDSVLNAKALALVNQPVIARVEIVTKPGSKAGQVFTNYNLEDIAPAQGAMAPAPVPVVAGGLPAAPTPAPAPHPHPAVMAQEERASEERRRSAMHAAGALAGQLYQGGGDEAAPAARLFAVNYMEELTRYAATGSFSEPPAGNPELQQEAAPVVAGGGLPWQT